MTRTDDPAAPDAWDAAACERLIHSLWALRETLLSSPQSLGDWIERVDPLQTASAINLAHYLALRQHDLRAVQEELARLGLSSLGRGETHVLANLDKVLGILHRLAGQPWAALSRDEPAGSRSGPALLEAHALALFGPAPPSRSTRIMVTLPSEAASDDALLSGLVAAGMDVARINCAHDDPVAWLAMAAGVRRAAKRNGRPVRVLMDLGGPKLRTGPVVPGESAVKLKPTKDAVGRVTAPAWLGLRAMGTLHEVRGADVCVGVQAAWLDALQPGDRLEFTDAADAQRRACVVERQPGGVLLSCKKTSYLSTDTVLRKAGTLGDRHATPVAEIAPRLGALHLQRGDMLDLLPEGVGQGPAHDAHGNRVGPARIACTLPEALHAVRVGDSVWFDDGRIGGVVRQRLEPGVRLEITQARDGGERLLADKGINLPDSPLKLPALTPKDLQDLRVAVRCADLVGLSFAQSAADVLQLQTQLADLGASHLSLVLKIETRRGFEHLPEMLFAAMRSPCAGVMIARGDLAVECGFERLAEIQEEILWACEAAHVPVIWATQVLENLAKTGLPSRAEVTDAAMSERAECVMLNKGPHILDAMHALDGILGRMQSHQLKKRSLLRALAAWDDFPPAHEGA